MARLSKSAASALQLMCIDMHVGDTQSFVCPDCGGGRSQEKAFTVTKQLGRLAYICHRASCGVAGYVDLKAAATYVEAEQRNTARIRPYQGAIEDLSDADVELLMTTYNLSIPELLLLDPGKAEDDVFVYPVRDYRGTYKGSTTRTRPTPKTGKRVMTYKATDSDTFLSWYLHQTINHTNSVILVEDIFSAVRASKYMDAVALHGTHLGLHDLEEVIAFCRASGTDHIILALDQDATATAIRYKNKYAAMASIVVLPLEKDIKNMTDEELKEWLG